MSNPLDVRTIRIRVTMMRRMVMTAVIHNRMLHGGDLTKNYMEFCDFACRWADNYMSLGEKKGDLGRSRYSQGRVAIRHGYKRAWII